MKVLILGGTGMLGHVLLRHFNADNSFEVFATSRDAAGVRTTFPEELAARFVNENIDADSFEGIVRVLDAVRPDVVVNCIGIIKQLPEANEPLVAIAVNSLLPHRIAAACADAGARMVHISTDCVFDGRKGMYTEDDNPSPEDLYGRSKLLGEVDYPHCVTLRTSIIGHEHKTRLGLIEWFLGETGAVRGFTKAIYTGFPTVEMARIISDSVIPCGTLHGVYHVSSEPISKYDLLHIVADCYAKKTAIERFDDFALDRSLVSARFRAATGYEPPSWQKLVEDMYGDYEANRRFYGPR